MILFPDGEEKEIKRAGPASILEGKKILKAGSRLRVQALVSELMSIHPECSYIESARIFKPHILVITNVRLDHLAQMGSTKENVARCLAASIPEQAKVFVLQEEFFPVFREAADRLNSTLIQVPGKSSVENFKTGKKFPFFEFDENIRLALAVAGHLGIEREVSLRGINKVNPDFGSLKAWTADLGSPARRFYLVSGFAANDPESTRRVLSYITKKIHEGRREIIGLLNLRQDRGDRTVQWLRALEENFFPEFQKLIFIGDHAPALKRKLQKSGRELLVFKERAPREVMEKISRAVKGEAVLVGMGNMGGIGKKLVEYWEMTGEPYDL